MVGHADVSYDNQVYYHLYCASYVLIDASCIRHPPIFKKGRFAWPFIIFSPRLIIGLL